MFSQAAAWEWLEGEGEQHLDRPVQVYDSQVKFAFWFGFYDSKLITDKEEWEIKLKHSSILRFEKDFEQSLFLSPRKDQCSSHQGQL